MHELKPMYAHPVIHYSSRDNLDFLKNFVLDCGETNIIS